MSNLKHIRDDVFGVTQAEFAAIAGVTQATVSRWERGEFLPGMPEMIRIRAEALSRNLEWDDGLFFADVANDSETGASA